MSDKRLRTYEQIAEILRATLHAGMLADGTVLLEGQLAEIFGASRTPVRQALELLRSEGLLNLFEGRGLIVGDGAVPPIRTPLSAAHFKYGDTEVTKRAGWQNFFSEVERILIHSSVFGRFRVNEMELARHYGVGRTIAHDLLLQAERTGIVAKCERGRWATVRLDERRLRHLYELRALLEPEALITALPRLDVATLNLMQERLRDAVGAYPNMDGDTLDRLEHDLHVDCVSRSDNPELLEALQRTRCIIISSHHILGTGVPLPTHDPFFEEHIAIFEALRTSDPARISLAVRAHINSAAAKVINRLNLFRAAGRMPDLPYIGAGEQPMTGPNNNI